MPNAFRCPSTRESNLTPYVVVLSETTKDGKMNSLFGGDRSARIRDARDGPGRTLAVVEAQKPVPWTKPDADLHFNAITIETGPNSIGSNHKGDIAHVAWLVGSVQQLPVRRMSLEQLRAAITPNGGEAYSEF